MALTQAAGQALSDLKHELEGIDAGKFELLAGSFTSRLLDDTPIYIAKSGFQFGADGGTTGLRGRRLRIECKRYLENTALNPRFLAGEVTQACQHDPYLEAWVLISTKSVSETERNQAVKACETFGVAPLVFDWTFPISGNGLCALAALCAEWPDLVETHATKSAATFARALKSELGNTILDLRKDLEVWSLGFRALRAMSHQRLKRIWNDKAESLRTLNQEASGGSDIAHLLKRTLPRGNLTAWWSTKSTGSVCVVAGVEGVGKTWVALDWTNDSLDALPIVVVAAATAFGGSVALAEVEIRNYLAAVFQSWAPLHVPLEYWRARVERLLKRPPSEGESVFLFIDGLNQNPAVRWEKLAQTVQVESLSGRLRLLVTTRASFFERAPRQFGRLTFPNAIVPVDRYDRPELDEMLRMYGMKRTDMHGALLDLAAVPRLFPLVQRLKDSSALQSEASVTRLLYEYGRDVLQQRQGESLTEEAWTGWLIKSARRYREGIERAKVRGQNLEEVGVSLASPELSPDEVARRLSEVIDGQWLEVRATSVQTSYVLRKDAATLALAIALIYDVESSLPETYSDVRAAVDTWLEPIAAYEDVSDVVRAAISVLSSQGETDGKGTCEALLVAWMHLQNPTSTFAADVAAFGEALPLSMLRVIEESGDNAKSVARYLAIQAVRRFPLSRTAKWATIKLRLVDWVSWISLPSEAELARGDANPARAMRDRLNQRLGTASAGTVTVMGVPIHLAQGYPHSAVTSVPAILEGHRLDDFPELLLAAAVVRSIHIDDWNRFWKGLLWLIFVGAEDENATRAKLLSLAETALTTTPEAGVHTGLPTRVAVLLLWLSQEASNERRAATIQTGWEGNLDYDRHYLQMVVTSGITLERRHVPDVLSSPRGSVVSRLERIRPFIADPILDFPPTLTEQLKEFFESVKFDDMDRGQERTSDERQFEDLTLFGARMLPTVYATAVQRRLDVISARTGEPKYWGALRALQYVLAIDEAQAKRLSGLRVGTLLSVLDDECIANTWLLQLELLHLPLQEQLDVLAAQSQLVYSGDLFRVLRQPAASDLTQFLLKHPGSLIADRAVMEAIVYWQVTEQVDDQGRLLAHLKADTAELMSSAFAALSYCSTRAMGGVLDAEGWKPEFRETVQAHYGSIALVEATLHLPFSGLVDRIAPWWLFDAVVRRGSKPDEMNLALKEVLRILQDTGDVVPSVDAQVVFRPRNGAALGRISVAELSPGNQDELFAAMFKPASTRQAERHAFGVEASVTIHDLRANGFPMFLQQFSVEGLRAAWALASAHVLPHLEGMESPTDEFLRRLRSAEGMFLGLCEALLEVEEPLGARLWRVLREHLQTRFVGEGEVPELTHMLFRVPENPSVLLLRMEMLSLKGTPTDQGLLDIVIAAQLHRKDGWLASLIADDKASSHLWQRKRAIVLEALCSRPAVNALVWPEGSTQTSWEALQARMSLWANSASLAFHWWQQFAASTSALDALAAWEIFLECVDRRACIWLDEELQRLTLSSDLGRMKRMHILMNWDRLSQAMLRQEQEAPKFAENLFGTSSPKEWLTLDGFTAS
jgi:hypothetical protein